MVEAAGIPLADALKMASLTPARLIGADGRKGRIEQCWDADIVLLDESDLSVKGVMIAGKWH
jgi:N-acetylglucosamine-6-phosphate deacetylase